MPKKEFITIQQAAKLAGKSVQTIRRAVKAKKIKVRKEKTPQGFNYRIYREQFLKDYDITPQTTDKIKSEKLEKAPKTVKIEIEDSKDKKLKKSHVTKTEFQSLTRALEKLINQHSEERQGFLRLVNTLNEKMFSLENQLKLLQAPKKSWLKFWK